MVYESDFYTTRRPYRPSTTYSSLTAELIYRPTSRSVTRLVTYPEPPHHVVRVRVRPSVVLRELDRINHRVRPQLAVTALDNYYNAESTKTAKYKWAKPSTYVPNLNRVQFDQGKPKMFEEEKRRIRAETEYLLSRARSVVPRAKTLAPSDTIYTYSYGEPIPYRFSDAYVAQMPRSLRSVVDHINHVSFYKYHETPKKFTVKLQPWRPSRKFQAPKTMDDPSEELKAAKAEREARFRATTAEPVLAPAADLAEIKRKRQEEARAAEEKALKEEAKREAERKAQADREAAEKKKAEDDARKAEESKRKAEEEARKAEEDARKAEKARLAEEAKKAEEAKLAEEARIAEEARLAEEAKKAEEARIAEEARLAEEAKKAEEARLAEEERQAEARRQEELARLEELERQAQDEREAELARQAAELAEIARQESELAAARLEELSHSGSAAEVAEPEPEFQDADAEPIVEEPESPAVDAPADEPAEASEDEQAEPDVTDEE